MVANCTVSGLFFSLVLHFYAFYYCWYKFQIGHLLEGLDLWMLRLSILHLNMHRIGKN